MKPRAIGAAKEFSARPFCCILVEGPEYILTRLSVMTTSHNSLMNYGELCLPSLVLHLKECHPIKTAPA